MVRRKSPPGLSVSPDQLLLSFTPQTQLSRDDFIFTAIDFKAPKRDVLKLINSLSFEHDASEINSDTVIFLLLLAGPKGFTMEEMGSKALEYNFEKDDNFSTSGGRIEAKINEALSKYKRHVLELENWKFTLKMFPALPTGGGRGGQTR